MSLSKTFLRLFCVIVLLFAIILTYALTRAFSWDEGFHLLAARLITQGQRPYLDFCFPQAPLNAYWNALWLRIFGDNWRAIHVIGSLLDAAGIFLAADFLLKRFPVSQWRTAAAITAALLIGLNGVVVLFGSIGQAYGLCLLLTVAAFRAAIAAVERSGPLLAAIAGLLVSASAAASLLTAPALPVLLIWIIVYSRAGSRPRKLIAFLVGAVIPFIPVLWLFAESPYKVFFNLIDYHLHYRRADWEGAGQHDFDVLLGWIDSGQALLLGLLASAGLFFAAARSRFDRAPRAAFYLCGWIALFIGVEIATAHPTFTWYFLLLVPFLAIPAAAGLYFVSSRLYAPDRVVLPVAVLAILLGWGLIKTLVDDVGSVTWGDMEAIAKKVQEVTPANGTLWASEHIYFLTNRPVPDGFEFQPGLKQDMPLSQAAPLHILPALELARRVKQGAYATIAICDDEKIEELSLPQLYRQRAKIGICTVFWDHVNPAR